MVEQAEIELGVFLQAQGAQRAEIRVVAALARYRQMQPVKRAAQRRCEAVGYGDQFLSVVGLLEVTAAAVAVTQMESQLDSHRHAVADPDEPRQDFRLRILEFVREYALENAEFNRRVPLDRQLVRRNGRRD